MNLIIVDDEIFIVRALQKNIDWQAVGIDETFIAFNAEKAREIFETREIDIMVTDIEMPRESGLDLIGWVREQGYECKIICLTCHGEFRYAQKAMRLQVSDYILKPVDFGKLSELVGRMVTEIRKECLEKEERKKGELWQYHQNRLESAFWLDILKGAWNTDPDTLMKEAQKVNIVWDFNRQYQVVFLSVKRVYQKKQDWNENPELMQFILYNISRDTFLTEEDANRAGWFGESCMWAVISAENSEGLYGRLEHFIDVCQEVSGVGIVAYVDEICYGEELHRSFQRMLEYDRENVSLERGIFDILGQSTGEQQDSRFYQELRKFLKNREWEQAEHLADEIWDENCYITFRKLVLHEGAGEYEIYRCMEENQIDREEFWNDELLELADKMIHSAGIYKEWLKKSVKRIRDLSGPDRTEKKMILQIEQYVISHIEERITRENIARAVGFSVDYISRFFKKETGKALSEYIMEQKIERAKELIDKAEEPIGNIASRLGYSNFSYFSEIFRRLTGVLPSEYKRNSRTE
ncbi:response regulator [Lachnoclostridium sp. An169]|uniref:response regulator n=1 Tax=Lachnoclostridium sp. An169 TaxID=1965569 RepID=UPI0013A6443B|nr:response regulator [Lachnoclostridium sp. An169]